LVYLVGQGEQFFAIKLAGFVQAALVAEGGAVEIFEEDEHGLNWTEADRMERFSPSNNFLTTFV
jgi:hypothetical protein